MTLRAALAEAAPAAGLRFAAPPARTPTLAATLVARYGDDDARRPPAGTRAALLQRLRQARFEWARIDPADRRHIAWVLCSGTPAPAAHADFLRAYLGWLATPWRRVQSSRVAAGWAAAFDPDDPACRDIAAWLAAHAAQLLDPWPRLAEAFALFVPAHGAQHLAAEYLTSAAPAAAFFNALGLHRDAALGGLGLAVLREAADLVARQKPQPRLAARLVELALFWGPLRADPQRGIAAPRLRDAATRLAEALLLPWRDAAPPGEVTAAIADYLLRQRGDPRVAGTDWRGIDPAATAIMVEWLKARTLATFFRLAARRKGSDPARLRARQRFWSGYLGAIDDSWLAVGSQGAAMLAGERLGHARLLGCRADDCALLLRIGGITIVETAPATGESVWLGGNALAPVIDHHPEHAYLLGSLATGADFSSGYHAGEGGTWEQRLGAVITRRSGITARPA